MAKAKKPATERLPGPLVYGGALTQTIEFRPGVLEALVMVSRRYSKAVFTKIVDELGGTLGRTNSAPVIDDRGRTWKPGELLRIGSNGVDEGGYVAMVHKFVPVSVLYPADALAFISAGKPLI